MTRAISIFWLILALPTWSNLPRSTGPDYWPVQVNIAQRPCGLRCEQAISTGPASIFVSRVFDPAGNQITLTNRNGKRWQFQFDGANRLTNTITPLNRQTKTLFNNRGLPQLITQPSGHTNALLYDAKGKATNRTDQVGTTSYKFDANNNLTNVAENGQTLQRQYDAYDRLTSYRDADGNLIQYRMDANGNVTNLIYPDGKVVKYFYDNLNRLTNVTDWASRKTSFTYDLASRLTSITRPNGTIRSINYDAAGETTNIIEQTLTGGPIAFFKLNWNAAARVEWEFTGPLPHAFTPPTRTMTFDDENRLATFNGSGVTIDLDGNLTYGPITNNSFTTYAYDARNRLLAVGGLNYGYDPAGSRTSITNGTNITRFVINPGAALSQVLVRVKNGVTNYYVYGLGLLYEADVAGSTKTYHYDYRGSTIALTDGIGLVTDRIEYSIYGTTAYRGGTSDTPFLYNGRYGVMSDANGLLCMRARYYNPYLCRFINPDPSGFSGGLNFYAYADGNPVSLLDPFGLGAFGEGAPSRVEPSFGPSTGWEIPITAVSGSPQGDPFMYDALLTGAPALLDTGVGRQLAAQNADSILTAPAFGILGEYVAGLVARLAAAEGEMVTVTHFTDAATVGKIQNGTGMLNPGTFVTLPGEVTGMNAAQVEMALEIDAGKGAYSTVFQTPRVNLGPAFNGPITSSGKIQFQLIDPTTPGPFLPHP